MDDLTGLFVVGLPLLVGALGLTAARRVPAKLRPVISGVVVVLACLLVQGTVAGWPKFPPRQSLDLLALIVVCAGLLSATRGRWFPFALAVVLAAAPAWFLLGRLSGMEPTERAGWSVATAVVLFLLWWPTLAKSSRSAAGPGVLAVVAGGAAGAALFSHSAKVAAITGALAVCLGLIAVLTLRRPCAHISRGASLAGVVILGALLVYDQHFLETPPLELALLVAGWGSLPWAARDPAETMAVRRQLQGALLAAVPVIAAVVVGFLRYQAEQQSNPYY